LATFLSLSPFFLISSFAYNAPQKHVNRRALINKSGVTFFSILATSSKAVAAATTTTIKVTPLAHTFILSKDGSAKPIRENDATRILTNARVVFLFCGDGKNCRETTKEILELTFKRKKGEGPGVTPGDVHIAVMDKAASSTWEGSKSYLAVEEIKSLDDIGSLKFNSGDVLFVQPLPSTGVKNDAKIIADCASKLGVNVGSEKSGGVVSVLINGARAPNALTLREDDGSTAATLLWYDIA